MSDSDRTPDQFVKRASTTGQLLQQSTAFGTTGSTLGLAALYISQCLSAHRLVPPSNEMIMVLLGLCVPTATLIWQVFNAKIRKWALDEGVANNVIATCIICIALSACATVPTGATKDQVAQARFDQACKYATGVVAVAKPLLPVIDPKIGRDARLGIRALFASIDSACSVPIDVNNASDVTQRIYDTGGQIVALVIQAQSRQSQ